MNIETTKAELIGIIEAMQTEEVLERMKSNAKTLKAIDTQLSDSNYSFEEAELIERAKNAIPQEITQKYDDLYLKFVSDDTPDEKKREQLIKLNDELLDYGTQRLKYLLHLSRLWGMSVNDVMQKIDLQALNHA